MKIFTQNKDKIRNSDFIFFGTLLTVGLYSVTAMIYSIITTLPMPFYKYAYFWWAFLLPFALTKAWIPNSILGKWMDRYTFR